MTYVLMYIRISYIGKAERNGMERSLRDPFSICATSVRYLFALHFPKMVDRAKGRKRDFFCHVSYVQCTDMLVYVGRILYCIYK